MNVMNQVIAVLSLFVLAVSGCDDTSPQNDYCYREGFTEYKCICPWSTCERSGSTYDCKLTGFSIAFIVVGSVLTCIGIGLCIFCCVKCCCNKPTQQANSGEPVYAYPATQGGAPQDGAYPPPQGGAYPPPQGGAYPPPQDGAYPAPQGGAYPPPQDGTQAPPVKSVV